MFLEFVFVRRLCKSSVTKGGKMVVKTYSLFVIFVHSIDTTLKLLVFSSSSSSRLGVFALGRIFPNMGKRNGHNKKSYGVEMYQLKTTYNILQSLLKLHFAPPRCDLVAKSNLFFF